MALPEDLLEQADALLTQEIQGRPKQASLRRAVSAAYYALFHRLSFEVSKQLVWNYQANKQLAGLLRRALTHGNMDKVSRVFASAGLPRALRTLFPAISSKLKQVAQTFVDLQQARHEADYNLTMPVTRQEAIAHVVSARKAFDNLDEVRDEDATKLYLPCLALLDDSWKRYLK